MLVGLDEAGRGPVLGPLVIGICAVPENDEQVLTRRGVKDSKDLSATKRSQLETWFYEQCEAKGWYGTTVSIPPGRIDLALQDQGLNWLEVEGFREALNRLPQRLNATVIADACDVNAGRFTERIATGVEQWPWPGSSMRSEHKADQNHPVVAMASILAKEERDRSLRALSQKVGFDVGSGYPSDPITKKSLQRLVLQSGIDEDVRWGWATVERFWSKHRSGDVPVRGRARTEQQRLFQSE